MFKVYCWCEWLEYEIYCMTYIILPLTHGLFNILVHTGGQTREAKYEEGWNQIKQSTSWYLRWYLRGKGPKLLPYPFLPVIFNWENLKFILNWRQKDGKAWNTPNNLCNIQDHACVPGEIQEIRISIQPPMAIKGENERLTSSPSSLVFSTGFSLSLTLGLVTTLIPPTCKRTALKSLQNFESYFLSRSVAALQIADCNVAHPQWILGDLKRLCTCRLFGTSCIAIAIAILLYN